jgi:hypothetical protein
MDIPVLRNLHHCMRLYARYGDLDDLASDLLGFRWNKAGYRIGVSLDCDPPHQVLSQRLTSSGSIGDASHRAT